MSFEDEPADTVWGPPAEPRELQVSQTGPKVGLDLFDHMTAKVNVSET